MAATSQSSKVSQNRVFDVSRDPKTSEMTTSSEIMSIEGKLITNTIRITKQKGCPNTETAPLIHLTKVRLDFDILQKFERNSIT